ncbi:2Fe-2S iron-sulfur cluster-binding protein [Sinorhizobium fredii]|uniref:2Fe-2S iron-sulfur cluster-binding protein n=1 Tax=Rhizobium fredii TaxID=380 RepID=UPI0004B9D1B0|nr:Isoquinoline 1-oxidoreductase alpha subunit [Sinorhizobium fredii CCBAU 25509]
MIMRAHALLLRNSAPDEAAIRDALEPSLCRCGTHMRILRAVRRASEGFQEQTSAAGESNQ